MTTTTTAPPTLLHRALALDAAVTGVNGAAYLLAAGPLADLLGLPAAWLRGTGVFLLVFTAAVGSVAARPVPSAVRAVVAANALWAAGSIAVVLAGIGTPTTPGAVWLVLQAAVVAAFAVLQAAGLRRS
ncbi:hypothetical protein [Geodermatophilus sabuli]|uniref:Integral membrane protein n=1 Tax=Geodermatophilus sabuli TaxID=1564158 RepID=A0A285EE59_9ACTN|nr:hypothetical protein [Geodermatophilus sabuli]MBB3086386.1 hypothetical protein [Geodermatophilus sabuli]SNX97399.1 hypothetical protein SAMN06893097_10739 [Geodermatophilus sabuli]